MLLLRNRSVMSLALLKWLPDEKKIDSYGMMNKQRRAFYFLLFSLCYIIAPPGNLGVIWQGIVLGVVFGSGLYLGYIGRLRDFFESWVLHPFDHPHHLQAGLPPWVWSIHTDLEFQTMCSFVSWEHNALITDGPGCRSGCPINKSPTILQWGSYKQTARTHCTFHLHS